MPAFQQLLFPDPRPLVERLGAEFFRRLPEHPGVYLMRDALDVVLYVGKAKNLRKRLTSYRVANPDRMPRRHLRMLRAVQRIELLACPDEASALAKESELLMALKPRFNRAGTWPAKLRFLVWRMNGDNLELGVTETPETDWKQFGPMGSVAHHLRSVLVRVLWCALHPEMGLSRMPAGWHRGSLPEVARINCGTLAAEAGTLLENLLAGEPDKFSEWAASRIQEYSHPFDKAAMVEELEFLVELFPLPPIKR